eukprot:2252835-Amphidinium_carterae.1
MATEKLPRYPTKRKHDKRMPHPLLPSHYAWQRRTTMLSTVLFPISRPSCQNTVATIIITIATPQN